MKSYAPNNLRMYPINLLGPPSQKEGWTITSIPAIDIASYSALYVDSCIKYLFKKRWK